MAASRAVGVVGEDEVVNGAFFAAWGAGFRGVGPDAHAGHVGAGASLPVGFGQDGRMAD